MVETLQLPPDPEPSDSKFLANLRMQVTWSSRGEQAVQDGGAAALLISEATPPDASAPSPKLLGMLLNREELIAEIEAGQKDRDQLQDQLGALQQGIYDEKAACGIPVVEPPNPPLDNDN